MTSTDLVEQPEMFIGFEAAVCFSTMKSNSHRLWWWAMAATLPATVALFDQLFRVYPFLLTWYVRDLLSAIYIPGLIIAPIAIPFALAVTCFGQGLGWLRRSLLLVTTTLCAFGVWWAWQGLRAFAQWKDA